LWYVPRAALEFSQSTVEDRQLQTRLFDTADEAELLPGSAGVLRELGFDLKKSDME
jgi:hypothetical protein